MKKIKITEKAILQFFGIIIVSLSVFLSRNQIFFTLQQQPHLIIGTVGSDEFSQREKESTFLKKYIGGEKIISYVSDPPCDAYCQMTTSYFWIPVIIDYLDSNHKYIIANFSDKDKTKAYTKENSLRLVNSMNNIYLLSNERK